MVVAVKQRILAACNSCDGGGVATYLSVSNRGAPALVIVVMVLVMVLLEKQTVENNLQLSTRVRCRSFGYACLGWISKY